MRSSCDREQDALLLRGYDSLTPRGHDRSTLLLLTNVISAGGAGCRAVELFSYFARIQHVLLLFVCLLRADSRVGSNLLRLLYYVYELLHEGMRHLLIQPTEAFRGVIHKLSLHICQDLRVHQRRLLEQMLLHIPRGNRQPVWRRRVL